MRAASFVTVVLLAALGLRWPIASHDVDHYVGPDEGEVVENVLEMVKTGDFDHRHRGYPGLHFYLQMVPVKARLLYEGRPVSEIPRSLFYREARRTTLVAGVLTGAAAFAAGLRFLSPWAAALAGALIAVSPLPFRESAVVNPDLMLSLFVALSLYFSLRLLETRTWGSFLAAGAAVGLATAIKYTGAFAVVPYAVAFFLGPEPGRYRGRALAGLAVSAAAFAVASPYTIWNLPESVRGLGMHAGYYRASDSNAALELLKALLARGLGVVAGLAAAASVLLSLKSRDAPRLVVLAYPVGYLLVFAFFDRAFARHALPLLAPLALLAADIADRLPRRWALVASAAMLAGPILATFELWQRARRPTPAERAARWVESELPRGSRVLQDQYTPRLDPDRFLVHRMEVEERVFPGNFDWVLYSGYPPGLETEGLREVARFETEGGLGDPVLVFQAPPRESLMGVSLAEGEPGAGIGAGELPYFGAGWDPPQPGAFGTERLSRGETADLYFVLPPTAESTALRCELTLAVAVAPVGVELEVNGESVSRFELSDVEPASVLTELHARGGLNRLRLRFDRTARLDRRHREAAVRFYRMELSRIESRIRRR